MDIKYYTCDMRIRMRFLKTTKKKKNPVHGFKRTTNEFDGVIKTLMSHRRRQIFFYYFGIQKCVKKTGLINIYFVTKE